MKLNRTYWVRLTFYLSILSIFPIWCLLPLSANGQESGSGALSALGALQRQNMERLNKRFINGTTKFHWSKLQLDLPPDTVLATSQGNPLVYANEFNQRIASSRGKDLFQIRYNLLREIINNKLVSAIAREEGFEKDPSVVKKMTMAEAEIKTNQKMDEYRDEVTTGEAKEYYRNHLEKFKLPDRGTRALFVVKGTHSEAQAILKRIKEGDAIDKLSFSPSPIAGSQLPVEVQEAIFHLEPGQMTEAVDTPVGFYIAKLVERNAFDHFKVSVIVKNNSQQCQEVLEEIKAGKKFEELATGTEQLSMSLDKLPQKVQAVVPDLELNEISPPIVTNWGCFLVKLQERWSDAEIITAKLIRLNSKTEGEEMLSRMKKDRVSQQAQERQVTGKDLLPELREAVKRLKEGEYSKPLKTSLGYYLVKVQKRVRRKYKPFASVREDVTKMVKAEVISNKSAREYYASYKTYYRKSAPDYIVDLILAETLEQGKKIAAELEKGSDKKKKAALFAKHQKELRSISADLLPVKCQKIARELQPGQISPLVTTPVGYFILRFNKKLDPSYLAFEDVKSEIKLLLAEQSGQRDEKESNIYASQIEEESLSKAYFKASVLESANTVSDEEAEEWWENNKSRFFNVLGITEDEFTDKKQLGDFLNTMRFKKVNLQAKRYRDMVKDLYLDNNVIINENLLRQ